jgi:hypothetical protein
LATFKRRFTPRGLTQIFVYCAFPVHVWVLVNMFRDVPSWVLYMPGSEIVGMVGYTLSFALFETLFALVLAIMIGMVIPKRWVVDKYIPMISLWLVELAVMAVVFQHYIIAYLAKRTIVMVFAGILVVSSLILLRFPKIGDLFRWIADRLVLLSFIYIFFDVLGVLVVILRNV